MLNKKVSVIMSVYKEPVIWLNDSIYSILNQSHSNIEIIIVLDCPERFDVIEFINNINDDRVIFIKNPINKGLIFSLNEAINVSTGEYIARMDADDVSHIQRIEKQLSYLTDNKLDLIGCGINIVDINRNYLSSPKKISKSKYISMLLKNGVTPLVHPTFFGKSNVFKGCYYNELAIYAEDLEFICHAYSLEFKIGNCNDILLDCRYSEESVTKKNAAAMELTVENIVNSFKKYLKTSIYVFSYKNKLVFESDIKLNLMKFRTSLKNRNYIFSFFYLIKSFCENPVYFYRVVKRFFLINILFFLDKGI